MHLLLNGYFLKELLVVIELVNAYHRTALDNRVYGSYNSFKNCNDSMADLICKSDDANAGTVYVTDI